jgi:hypothetical protein
MAAFLEIIRTQPWQCFTGCRRQGYVACFLQGPSQAVEFLDPKRRFSTQTLVDLLPLDEILLSSDLLKGDN